MNCNYYFNFDEWDANDFYFAQPLLRYIETLKTELSGKILRSLHGMGCLFNHFGTGDEPLENRRHLTLDEPLILLFDCTQLEIGFNNTSHVKIGFNTLPLAIRTGEGFKTSDVTCCFKEIVGQKVMDVRLSTFSEGFCDSVAGEEFDGERPDGGDYFGYLFFEFENAWILAMSGDMEFMNIVLYSRDETKKADR
jgi:hypothetical protein